MNHSPADFKESARINSADENLRRNVRRATSITLKKREEVVAEIPDWEELRQQGHNIRKHAIQKLDFYLEEFEKNLTANGAEVLWAKDSAEACQLVEGVLAQSSAKRIVKSKSMVTEEIGLNHYLESRGYESVETDLGEYIVQLAGETPSHITAPALHKSKEEIGKLFSEKLGVQYTSEPSQLTMHARGLLREKFLNAEAGISGANFLVAESGTVLIVENEGNAALTTSLPETHIVITGIEKVVPTLQDASILLKLLPRSATAQRMTSYVSFINGPKKQQDLDGPKRLVVILLDNGRSDIMSNPEMREALYCIRCGACMNVCPVYQTVGGHAYGSTYPGPIGAVLTPLLTSLPESKDLPFASSLCGACSDICPVKIDLHHLLLWHRAKAVQTHLTTFSERVVIRLWNIGMKNPGLYRFGSKMMRLIFRGKLKVPVWSAKRDLPDLPPKPFHELWETIK